MNDPLDAAICRRLRGLLRLAEAATEAEAANINTWQYAVHIDVLRNHSGLTNADVGWLVQERLAEHRVEITREGARERAFRRSASFNPAAAACFVLSPAGLRLARKTCGVLAPRVEAADLKPKWEPTTGDWTLGGALVKRLPANAHAQRKVLDKCQDDDWADEIDSPFADMPPTKQRNHYLSRVLDHLNNGQQEARIHFSAVKKGRRIRWKVIDQG